MAKQETARKRYRSDLTDEQWVILEPLLPLPRTQHGGTPRRVNRREVLDTLLYQNRTGCQWDMLPQPEVVACVPSARALTALLAFEASLTRERTPCPRPVTWTPSRVSLHSPPGGELWPDLHRLEHYRYRLHVLSQS